MMTLTYDGGLQGIEPTTLLYTCQVLNHCNDISMCKEIINYMKYYKVF